MKRFLRYVAIALGSTVLFLALALFWLLASQSGARWLVAQGSALLPEIRVEGVEGTLRDGLILSGLHYAWPGGTLTIERVQLQWDVVALLRAHLHLRELTITGVSIGLVSTAETPQAPDSPQPWQWPTVSGWPLRVAATIDRLACERLTLSADGAQLAMITAAQTRLSWRDGVVEINEMTFSGPRLTGAGESYLGLVEPAFFADLHGTAPAWSENLKDWSIVVDLTGGQEQSLNGTFRLALTAPAGTFLALQGDLALDPKQLRFSAVQLLQQPPSGEVTATAAVALDASQPRLQLAVEFRDVDLQTHFDVATRLSGRLDLQGEPHAYQGTFAVTNDGAGWRQLALQGALRGNLQELTLTGLEGALLQGIVSGGAQLNWTRAPLLRAQLQGRGLDAGAMAPLPVQNVDADLDLTWQPAGREAAQGRLNLRLLRATVAGEELAGEVETELRQDDLFLSRLDLHGVGFTLRGSGQLRERLNLTLDFARPDRPDARVSGTLAASAWLSYRGGRWAGAASVSGRQFRSGPFSAATLSAELAAEQDGLVQLQLASSEVILAGVHFTSASASGSGTMANHQLQCGLLWPGGKMDLTATGGSGAEGWHGRIETFVGADSYGGWHLTTPVDLAVGGEQFEFSPIHLAGGEGEVVNLTGSVASGAPHLTLTGNWQNLQLARLHELIPELALLGRSQGEVTLTSADGALQSLRASGSILDGTVALNGRRLGFSGEFSFAGDGVGQQAALAVTLVGGGGLRGDYRSLDPLGAGLPGVGMVQANWSSLPPKLFLPTLADGLTLTGGLDGELSGHFLDDGRFDFSVHSTLLDGSIAWQDGSRQITAILREVALKADWRGDTFAAETRLVLGEYGRLAAELRLPLPARWPLQMQEQGPLAGRLTANFKEQGILGVLLPGMVRESRGVVVADLTLAGTPAAPQVHGTLQMNEVGGYLPAAGITLKEGACLGRIEGETLSIESCSVKSGQGRLAGTGSVQFSGGTMSAFAGTLKGEGVELINLPELQVSGNPDLTFSGSPEKLRLTGNLLLSNVLVRGRKGGAPIQESGDVVLVSTETAATGKSRDMALDVAVRVTLGKQVQLDLAGIYARLEGEVLVRGNDWTAAGLSGNGKVEVKEGTYSAYGMKLDIEKGVLLFAGGAIDEPTLDVLAVRKIDEVKAGVRVGGTPRDLTVTLYSVPAMQDTDILSYIVFGEPLGADTSQLTLLSTAAAVLLMQEESGGLQDNLLKRLGIDRIDVSLPEGTLESSVVTVGKYLGPDLYISIGQSVFSGFEQLRLRYDISEKWQVESSMGDESAADLYYKIEFD